MVQALFFEDSRGRSPVLEFMETLPLATQQKIAAWIDLLEAEGHQLKRPYADKLCGALYELRARFGADRIRIIYFFFHRDKIILLHIFRKKSDRVEARDIALAEKRMADYLGRQRDGKPVL
ncbi:MAG: type II toxin-antitoxin system RelE/ParE family toxin [Candidatus Omnitrophica bacterium]|nr:type II toxin-antitoxin system RelE/ParE family toxin [Candidatus Omnitrophota bacterium]MDD5670505.1 type II toxin-antitoxin system RelE/ParE family toxin [Candidatus Omnitrophota bacterium]